jgi:hypothetical protein
MVSQISRHVGRAGGSQRRCTCCSRCDPQSPADTYGARARTNPVRGQGVRDSGSGGRPARRLGAQDGGQEDRRSDALGERSECRSHDGVGRRRGEGGRSARGEYARRVVRISRKAATLPAMVRVPEMRRVRRRSGRAGRHCPRTGAEPEVGTARPGERHEAYRDQRPEQQRRQQQPGQPPLPPGAKV